MAQNLFDLFSDHGKLLLPNLTRSFHTLPWSQHPTFDGVALKQLVSASQTNGEFSYHLVKIAPQHKIGIHTHPEHIETHEIIAGDGICNHDGKMMIYQPGIISIFMKKQSHEISAGAQGLYFFAKFFPALN